MFVKQLIPILIVLSLLAGCRSGPSTPDDVENMVAATTTAAPPTNSPEPTSTPAPTDTPTPEPTATTDIGATSTAEASEILAKIAEVLGDTDIPYQAGHLAWQQTEVVKIDMQGPQDDNFREFEGDPTAGNFILKSDVTWNATGILICGAIFRSEPDLKDGEQYQFYFYRLSGLPAYFIDVYKFGEFQYSVSKDQYADELDITNGSTNEFMLVAQDEQFNVYINGERQGRFFDNSKARMDGAFGFLAWQESGTGSCEFQNSWVWALE